MAKNISANQVPAAPLNMHGLTWKKKCKHDFTATSLLFQFREHQMNGFEVMASNVSAKQVPAAYQICTDSSRKEVEARCHGKESPVSISCQLWSSDERFWSYGQLCFCQSLKWPPFPKVKVIRGHLSLCNVDYTKVPRLAVICRAAWVLERKK